MGVVEDLLAGANGKLEAGLERRDGACRVCVVGREWVIPGMEIDKTTPAGERLGLEIATCRIGLEASQGIHERQEQTPPALVDRQFRLLPIDVKPKSSCTRVDLYVPGGCLHLDRRFIGGRLHDNLKSQSGILGKIP